MQAPAAAKLFKCFSEPLRLRIARILAMEELNGNELRAILDVPQSTLSRHLGVLKDSGLLATRREGTLGYYRIAFDGAANGSTGDLVGLARDLLNGDALADEDSKRLAAVLDERQRLVREHFETVGETWDEFHREIADHSIALRTMLRLMPAGLRVLDAGTGGGSLLGELAGAGAHVIAVDNAPSRIVAARRRAEDLGLEGVEFREGDLEALPLEDGSVDAAVAHLSLHHVSRPEVAVREMARVLVPGGALVITDFCSHESEWLRSEHADLWLGFEPNDVRRWMEAAGLVNLDGEVHPYANDERRRELPLVKDLELFVISGRKPLG